MWLRIRREKQVKNGTHGQGRRQKAQQVGNCT
jgi:hypothetical protein